MKPFSSGGEKIIWIFFIACLVVDFPEIGKQALQIAGFLSFIEYLYLHECHVQLFFRVPEAYEAATILLGPFILPCPSS